MKNMWLWVIGIVAVLIIIVKKLKKKGRPRRHYRKAVIAPVRRRRSITLTRKFSRSTRRRSGGKSGKVYHFRGRSTRSGKVWAQWMREARRRKR